MSEYNEKEYNEKVQRVFKEIRKILEMTSDPESLLLTYTSLDRYLQHNTIKYYINIEVNSYNGHIIFGLTITDEKGFYKSFSGYDLTEIWARRRMRTLMLNGHHVNNWELSHEYIQKEAEDLET